MQCVELSTHRKKVFCTNLPVSWELSVWNWHVVFGMLSMYVCIWVVQFPLYTPASFHGCDWTACPCCWGLSVAWRCPHRPEQILSELFRSCCQTPVGRGLPPVYQLYKDLTNEALLRCLSFCHVHSFMQTTSDALPDYPLGSCTQLSWTVHSRKSSGDSRVVHSWTLEALEIVLYHDLQSV